MKYLIEDSYGMFNVVTDKEEISQAFEQQNLYEEDDYGMVTKVIERPQ